MPSDAPPDEMTTSAFCKACSYASASASSRSGTIPQSITSICLLCNMAFSIGRLASKICACAASEPAATTSSPVDIMATRRQRATSICAVPDAASWPTKAAVIICPLVIIISPLAKFSPGGRILLAFDNFALITTVSPVRLQSSCIATQSGPGGMTAPV